MDLVAINQAIFDEFHRITGSSCRFQFPLWWAGVVRLVSQDMRAGAWELLPRAEQLAMVREYLAAQPPARWPSLRLVELT